VITYRYFDGKIFDCKSKTVEKSVFADDSRFLSFQGYITEAGIKYSKFAVLRDDGLGKAVELWIDSTTGKPYRGHIMGEPAAETLRYYRDFDASKSVESSSNLFDEIQTEMRQWPSDCAGVVESSPLPNDGGPFGESTETVNFYQQELKAKVANAELTFEDIRKLFGTYWWNVALAPNIISPLRRLGTEGGVTATRLLEQTDSAPDDTPACRWTPRTFEYGSSHFHMNDLGFEGVVPLPNCGIARVSGNAKHSSFEFQNFDDPQPILSQILGTNMTCKTLLTSKCTNVFGKQLESMTKEELQESDAACRINWFGKFDQPQMKIEASSRLPFLGWWFGFDNAEFILKKEGKRMYGDGTTPVYVSAPNTENGEYGALDTSFRVGDATYEADYFDLGVCNDCDEEEGENHLNLASTLRVTGSFLNFMDLDALGFPQSRTMLFLDMTADDNSLGCVKDSCESAQ
jgi:hypothetical protein